MRLWHIDLIPYLPKSQLIAQWRELNSIYRKQDNHILINYVYNYDKKYLLYYSNRVLFEMQRRGIKVKSFENYFDYFLGVGYSESEQPLRFIEHNDEYLLCNYYNLLEKYRRGQKDFSQEEFKRLTDFVNGKENRGVDALSAIHDLCIDYDGFNTVDGLKSLIDDIEAIVKENLEGKDRKQR